MSKNYITDSVMVGQRLQIGLLGEVFDKDTRMEEIVSHYSSVNGILNDYISIRESSGCTLRIQAKAAINALCAYAVLYSVTLLEGDSCTRMGVILKRHLDEVVHILIQTDVKLNNQTTSTPMLPRIQKLAGQYDIDISALPHKERECPDGKGTVLTLDLLPIISLFNEMYVDCVALLDNK